MESEGISSTQSSPPPALFGSSSYQNLNNSKTLLHKLVLFILPVVFEEASCLKHHDLCECFSTYPCFSVELSTHFMIPSVSMSDKPIHTLSFTNEDMNLCVKK